jgi:hypothetical protein
LEWQQSKKRDPNLLSFLDLPLEIREIILKLVFHNDDIPEFGYSHYTFSLTKKKVRYFKTLQLLRTCQQLHYEGARILYGSNTISYTTHVDGKSCYRVDLFFSADPISRSGEEINLQTPYYIFIRQFKIFAFLGWGRSVARQWSHVDFMLDALSTRLPNLKSIQMVFQYDYFLAVENRRGKLTKSPLLKHADESDEDHLKRLEVWIENSTTYPTKFPKSVSVEWTNGKEKYFSQKQLFTRYQQFQKSFSTAFERVITARRSEQV